ANRVAKVARPVRVRLVGPALRAGQHDRDVRVQQAVDQVDALLHRVRPMRHDYAGDPRPVRLLAHAPPEGERELPVDVEARDLREVVQLERGRLRPGEQLHELVATDGGDELPRRRIGAHGDGAAGRYDDDGPGHRAA